MKLLKDKGLFLVCVGKTFGKDTNNNNITTLIRNNYFYKLLTNHPPYQIPILRIIRIDHLTISPT